MEEFPYRAILFDLDGTLVTSWTTEPLPGVLEKLEMIHREQVLFAIATNQAGPLWREVTGKEKFPTVETIVQNIRTISERLHQTRPIGHSWAITVPWYISIFDPRLVDVVDDQELLLEQAGQVSRDMQQALSSGIAAYVSMSPGWRKPEPGMLLTACHDWDLDPREVLYVGDMESDRQAAENAGMPFVWAQDFFV